MLSPFATYKEKQWTKFFFHDDDDDESSESGHDDSSKVGDRRSSDGSESLLEKLGSIKGKIVI